MWINSQYTSSLLKNLNNYALRVENSLIGHDFIYLKRDKVSIDRVLNEVDKSIIKDTFPFKAVLELDRSFDTGGALLSKFGLSNDVELIFSISQEEFDKFKLAANDSDLIELTRPREGDLVYFPYNSNLWEITFCDNRPRPGYKYNPTLLWEVTCQLYEESNDTIVTGDVDLDKFDSDNVGNVFGMVLNVSGLDPSMALKPDEIVSQHALNDQNEEVVVWTSSVAAYNAGSGDLTLKQPIGEFDASLPIYSQDGNGMYTVLEVKEVIRMSNATQNSAQNAQFDALDAKILGASNKSLQSFKPEVTSPTNPLMSIVPPEVKQQQDALLAVEQAKIQSARTESITINKNVIEPPLDEFSADNPFGGN
jgi:hypothetical protein